jgi:hypothetical protein
MMRRMFALLLVSLTGIAGPVSAQQAKPLFSSSDPIRIAIQAPLGTLIRNREIRTPIAGTLTDPAGRQIPVNISLRGHVNRGSEVCDFPPLRIDFAPAPPVASDFAGEKSLKLMTHCHSGAAAQKYVLLHYATYQMYNVLTPRSFRARLANVDYRDANGRPIASSLAFFLEDTKDVAKRNGLKQVHAGDRIPTEWLSPADAARSALFEHMIANHDWSMRGGPAGEECCHNFKLLGVAAPGMTVPIPYDFDYSGFVDDPNALPPEELHISSVRQRAYRGYCVHNNDVLAAARQFRDARPRLIAAITQVPGLDARSQRRAIAFLDPFFSQIATDQAVGANLLGRCVR